MKTALKTSKLLKVCVWALLLLAGLHLGGMKTLAAARPSCEKTKTVYYQKQNMKNPLTQERYVVYDLLGTNEISVKNVSSKAVISNVKSSNSHISAYADSTQKKIFLELNYTAKTLKNGEKAVISFNVKQLQTFLYRGFPSGFCKKRQNRKSGYHTQAESFSVRRLFKNDDHTEKGKN